MFSPDNVDLAFFGVAVLAAAIAGAVAAPRLAADAARTGVVRRGWWAGALVTLAAFVLGAFLFALLPMLTSEALSVVERVGGLLWLFSMSLLVGVMYLLPALPLGMGAGWLFYRTRAAPPAGAV